MSEDLCVVLYEKIRIVCNRVSTGQQARMRKERSNKKRRRQRHQHELYFRAFHCPELGRIEFTSHNGICKKHKLNFKIEKYIATTRTLETTWTQTSTGATGKCTLTIGQDAQKLQELRTKRNDDQIALNKATKENESSEAELKILKETLQASKTAYAEAEKVGLTTADRVLGYKGWTANYASAQSDTIYRKAREDLFGLTPLEKCELDRYHLSVIDPNQPEPCRPYQHALINKIFTRFQNRMNARSVLHDCAACGGRWAWDKSQCLTTKDNTFYCPTCKGRKDKCEWHYSNGKWPRVNPRKIDETLKRRHVPIPELDNMSTMEELMISPVHVSMRLDWTRGGATSPQRTDLQLRTKRTKIRRRHPPTPSRCQGASHLGTPRAQRATACRHEGEPGQITKGPTVAEGEQPTL